jgi:predicted acetyltransferase
MMKLIEPAIEYAPQIRAYREEFFSCGSSMDGTGALRKLEDPEDWIEHTNQCKDPLTVPEGLVPATQYMLVREEDNKIVGMIQIRHHLNDYLAKYAGHIGYSVAPSERRKGYAAMMLEMALQKCREMHIDRVLITCIKGNTGSKKTILKNGGVYECDIYEPDDQEELERYWIDLSE